MAMPPFATNSKLSPTSFPTSNHKSRLMSANSSSGPGDLSETMMLPSPAPVVPLATVDRSITRVRNPALIEKYAHIAPTIPAPITMTSAEF